MSKKPEEKKPEENNEKEEGKEELLGKVDSLTNELIEMRKSRQEDREALDALLKGDDKDEDKKGEDEEVPEDDIQKKVAEEFAKREEAQKAKTFEEAEQEFRNSMPEFREDNDNGGLKYEAFKKELNKFNLSDLGSKEAYKARLKEVYEFMNRKSQKDDNSQLNQYASTNDNGGGEPKESDIAVLSKQETQLIKDQGWSKERYLKLREKQPQYVNSLLRYIN